jgi:hypothetical protein
MNESHQSTGTVLNAEKKMKKAESNLAEVHLNCDLRVEEAERASRESCDQLAASNAQLESVKAELVASDDTLKAALSRVESLERSQPLQAQSTDEFAAALGERGEVLRLHAHGTDRGNPIFFNVTDLKSKEALCGERSASSYDSGRYLIDVLGDILHGVIGLEFVTRELAWERCRALFPVELREWTVGRRDPAFFAILKKAAKQGVVAYK